MMKTKEYILIITEGEKTEKQIIDNIKKCFFDSERIEFLAYQTNIYNLFKELKKLEEDEIDIVGLVKEKLLKTIGKRKDIEGEENFEEKIIEIEREKFSQIFLFFDYDGHTENASDDELKEMLDIFSNETENGKLYISYPMVEALKHLKKINTKENIETYIIKAKDKINYKKIVSENTDFQNLTMFSKKDWFYIIQSNLERLKFLYDIKEAVLEYKYYIDNMSQIKIFIKEYEKYIITLNKILVLSSFPFFLIEYFGEEFYIEVLNDFLYKRNKGL